MMASMWVEGVGDGDKVERVADRDRKGEIAKSHKRKIEGKVTTE